jgi:hypothetical protein
VAKLVLADLVAEGASREIEAPGGTRDIAAGRDERAGKPLGLVAAGVDHGTEPHVLFLQSAIEIRGLKNPSRALNQETLYGIDAVRFISALPTQIAGRLVKRSANR